MSVPVTVSITRHIDPDHEAQMLAWLRAGTELTQRFDGFLGSGWVRPAKDSGEWHMLYRFADADSLAAWEASDQRRWWLDSAQGLVDESRAEKRTGIEGWFDEPSSTDVRDLRPGPVAPPRWKQMCVIFMVFFPLSLAANLLSRELIPTWHIFIRVFLTVVVMTPIMTYAALPWITKRFEWWLQGKPAPWRKSAV